MILLFFQLLLIMCTFVKANLDNNNNNYIPKIIHQTWKTFNIPIKLKQYQETLINVHKNKGWEYRLWDDILLNNFVNSFFGIFQKQSKNGYDSLMTVKKIQNRFYTLTKNNKVHTVNHNPNELIPTQQLDPLYEENSCLYIFTKYTLLQRHHRVGYNPYLHHVQYRID